MQFYHSLNFIIQKNHFLEKSFRLSIRNNFCININCFKNWSVMLISKKVRNIFSKKAGKTFSENVIFTLFTGPVKACYNSLTAFMVSPPFLL